MERTKNGPIEEFLVSYQSLLPSTNYYFRVIAYNKYGISYPVTSNNEVPAVFALVLVNFGTYQQFSKNMTFVSRFLRHQSCIWSTAI